mgnify:CR=1 FL=1
MSQVSMFYLGEGLSDKMLLTVVTDNQGNSTAYSQWSFTDHVEVKTYKDLNHTQVVELCKGKLS